MGRYRKEWSYQVGENKYHYGGFHLSALVSGDGSLRGVKVSFNDSSEPFNITAKQGRLDLTLLAEILANKNIEAQEKIKGAKAEKEVRASLQARYQELCDKKRAMFGDNTVSLRWGYDNGNGSDKPFTVEMRVSPDEVEPLLAAIQEIRNRKEDRIGNIETSELCKQVVGN